MADVFSRQKRSEVMSKIRGRGNRDTELALILVLRRHRLSGWRRHLPLPGRPDFAFPRARVAIFVDGCFWHQCPKCGTLPANNREFWQKKLAANVTRDRRVTRELRRAGWAVLRVWEHVLQERGGRAAVAARIRRTLAHRNA